MNYTKIFKKPCLILICLTLSVVLIENFPHSRQGFCLRHVQNLLYKPGLMDKQIETSVKKNSYEAHLSLDLDLGYKLLNKSRSTEDQTWGRIVDSPSNSRDFFVVKDLVYIKCWESRHELVREGDRFAILSNPQSQDFDINSELPESWSKILGEIEITSVGADLLLGIITDCRSIIHKDYLIAPFCKLGSQLRG